MKELATDCGDIFIINPETGYWGISRDSPESRQRLSEELNKRRLGEKIYSGTNLFVINSSNHCDLSCLYCLERAHRNCCGEIDLEVGKRTVDLALGTRTRSPQIVFHGSEPTMNWDFVKEVVDYGLVRSGSNGEISFSIQTNLVSPPVDFFQFVGDKKVGVSTSLDGPKEVHDLTRPQSCGMGSSYDKVTANIARLRDVQDKVHAICVVTRHNFGILEDIVSQFEDLGIDSMQFVPVESFPEDNLMPPPRELSRGYIKLFERILTKMKEGKKTIKLRNLAQYIASFVFNNPIDACRGCGCGTNHPLLAIDWDGKVYPCDLFFGEERAVCGDIFKDSAQTLANHPKNLRFRNIDDTPCKNCMWKRLCGGGCLASSCHSPDRRYIYCETNKRIYSYLAKIFPEILKAGILEHLLEWIKR